jgi:hypothetical protein
VHAMHVTTGISAVITLIGALVVLIWMPGRAAQAGAAQAEAARDERAERSAAEVPDAAEVPAGVAAQAGMES